MLTACSTASMNWCARLYMGDRSQATGDELAALAPQLLVARRSLDGYQAVQADLNHTDGCGAILV
jgi:hypothetical protein